MTMKDVGVSPIGLKMFDAETIKLKLHNSVELNARNIEIVGSTCLISASNIFKPIGATPTSFIV
ncbi:hypothetical protein ACC756_38330, partial [Rhizobium ruizarguesonis]